MWIETMRTFQGSIVRAANVTCQIEEQRYGSEEAAFFLRIRGGKGI